jgi:hypothetical protein
MNAAAEQRVHRSDTGGDVDEIAVEPLLLVEVELFGDPQRRPRAGDRRVRDRHQFELFVLGVDESRNAEKK